MIPDEDDILDESNMDVDSHDLVATDIPTDPPAEGFAAAVGMDGQDMETPKV